MAAHQELQMKLPEDFERVHPGFQLSSLVAQEPGALAHYRQELPRTNGSREFQLLRALLARNEPGEKQNDEQNLRDAGRYQQREARHHSIGQLLKSMRAYRTRLR